MPAALGLSPPLCHCPRVLLLIRSMPRWQPTLPGTMPALPRRILTAAPGCWVLTAPLAFIRFPPRPPAPPNTVPAPRGRL